MNTLYSIHSSQRRLNPGIMVDEIKRFSLLTAKAYAKKDQIENWIYEFLSTEGQHEGLAKWIKSSPGKWLGPMIVDLN